MTDREIVTEYRDIVYEIHYLRERIAWNIRHGLPVKDMPEKVNQLLTALLRFETIIDELPDFRTRHIIRCRYALGMTDHETSAMINLSKATVNRIRNDALQQLQD